MTMTPLQALMAHASPGAPFEEFARHIRSGSWSLDGDEVDKGLITGCLDANAMCGDRDGDLSRLVVAFIAAGARTPAPPSPDEHTAVNQMWRSRLPLCGLAINLHHAGVHHEDTERVMEVLRIVSSAARIPLADIKKALSLSPAGGGRASEFFAAPMLGLSTLALVLAATQSPPPLGVQMSGNKDLPRTAKVVAGLAKDNAEHLGNPLEKLLGAMAIDAGKSSKPDPALQIEALCQAQAKKQANQQQVWVEDIIDHVQLLPPLSRSLAVLSIINHLSPGVRSNQEGALATQLFTALVPILAATSSMDMRSLLVEGTNVTSMQAFSGVAARLVVQDDPTAALQLWRAMVKIGTPAYESRALFTRIMDALDQCPLPVDTLLEVLGDDDVQKKAPDDVLEKFSALASSAQMQSGVNPAPASRPASRL